MHEDGRWGRAGHSQRCDAFRPLRRRRAFGRRAGGIPRRLDELSAEASAGAVGRRHPRYRTGAEGRISAGKSAEGDFAARHRARGRGVCAGVPLCRNPPARTEPGLRSLVRPALHHQRGDAESRTGLSRELAKTSLADIGIELAAVDDGSIAARGCAFLEIHERKTAR